MKTRLLLALLLAASSASAAKPKHKPPEPKPPPPPVHPTSIDVSVVEVAGGRAFLQPGAKGGVHKSAIVTINGKEHHVLDVTDSYAVIDLQDGPVHEKDKGRASIVEEQETAKQLPPTHPLSTWEHAWAPEQPPSEQQTPQFVPLGEASRSRKYDVVLAFSAGGNVPFSGQPGASIGFVELDARVHAEPFSVPAAFDFDGALRFWAADDLSTRVGGTTRSYLWIRQLLASYGNVNGWYAGLGRMQYAASTLGTLDGLRLQANLGGGFTLAAFGGFLPNPLGGELSVDAERFGVEARYYRPDLKLRPEGAVVVHGSMFQGHPDERRVSAMFGVYPGHTRIGGHVEVSNFDADNPWKANPVEITAAGLDESVRFGAFELGSRIDFIEPERSKWLASYLPASWFCRTVPSPGTPTTSEPCDGASSMRALGSLNLGVSKGMVSATLGATASGDVSHGTEPRVIGGFFSGRVVRIAKVLRFELSGSYSNATYVNMFGGTVGLGVTVLHDAIDLSAYYRRAELQYASNDTYLEQNGFGGTMTLFPASTVMATVQTEAITGNDVNALWVFGTLVWRPRL
jgi:hypothetical protein